MTTRERPILFSGAMVRAILEGRKTQTRRVVKQQPPEAELGVTLEIKFSDHTGKWHMGTPRGAKPVVCSSGFLCPYGVPGDRLWVRETFYRTCFTESSRGPGSCVYRADGAACGERGWSSSIHMPRWASRLTLEIKDVRVERLQAISEADAIAEGVECEVYERGVPISGCWWNYQSRCWSGAFPDEPRGSFRTLWDSINGKTHPWSANPLVWVVEFAKV